MKALIAHMVAIALLTVIPGNPSECCRVQSWFEQPVEAAELPVPSCCHSPVEVTKTSSCCGTNESQHQQPAHAPCDCCLDSPDLLVTTTVSMIDLNPDVSFIDHVDFADDQFETTVAKTSTIDDSPPIAFTELYCVRRE